MLNLLIFICYVSKNIIYCNYIFRIITYRYINIKSYKKLYKYNTVIKNVLMNLNDKITY